MASDDDGRKAYGSYLQLGASIDQRMASACERVKEAFAATPNGLLELRRILINEPTEVAQLSEDLQQFVCSLALLALDQAIVEAIPCPPPDKPGVIQ